MTFADFFDNKPVILFDGAMGTQIYARGIAKGHCYDELNLSMPDLVMDIHRGYVDAGAQVLTTNTFGANRFILEEYFGLGDKTKDVNYYGARLASRAAKGKAFVAGSIGPVTRPLDRESARQEASSRAGALFKEQIEALIEGGADLILFETFSCLEELVTGIEVAHDVDPDLFVIAQMSFVDGGLTLFGKNPYETAAALDRTSARVLGSNCGAGPQNVLEAVKKMGASTKKTLSAMPNAGIARFADGRFTYPHNPAYFARYAAKMVAAGVKVVGGCCGTGPEHIAAIAEALVNKKPGKRRPPKVPAATPTQAAEHQAPIEIPSKLKALMEQRFIVGLELDPPKGASVERFIEKAKPFAHLVDVVNISDSPMARPRMSPIAVGRLVQDALGVEAVVHYTCRDRNVLGMQSDLLGAWALGLRNFLALGGDPPSIGDYPFATGVYDLTSEGLVELVSDLNHGHNLLGAPIGQASGFFIGIAASAGAGGDAELTRLALKIEKGAHFIITQPIFDSQASGPFLRSLRALGVPVIAGIMPMISQKNAEYLHYEVPGISIPAEYLSRMESLTGTKGRAEGLAIAIEIVEAIASDVNGILVMPPTGRLDAIEAIVASLRERSILP